MINITTQIKSLKFNNPIFNAAGVWCTTEKDLIDLAQSQSGAVIFKTMTVNPRVGNPKPRLYLKDYQLSVNSMGLPNLGIDFYCKIANQIKQYNKPIIASIAGFNEKEFYILSKKASNYFDAIEINLSCPNLVGKGIFAYDIKTSLRVLATIREKTDKIIGVKLPPYYERSDIQQMTEGLVKIGIDFVSLINSVPLGCVIDYHKERMRIKPNMGIGGLGGRIIKSVALAQVVLFRYFLQDRIKIIGVGGIQNGQDIYEYILAGASAVGIGTALQYEGPMIFNRLKKELRVVLNKKNISDINKKIGKLKMP